MQNQHAGDYVAESYARFAELLRCLGEEHQRLHAFTQDVVRELKVESVMVHGGDSALEDEPIPGDTSPSQSPMPRLRVVPVSSSFRNKANNLKVDRLRAHSIPQSPRSDLAELDMDESDPGTPSPRSNKSGNEGTEYKPIGHRTSYASGGSYVRSSTLEGIHPSILHRLQARVGVLNWRSHLSYTHVLNAAYSLGLEKYTAHDMRKLIRRMVDVSGADQKDLEENLGRRVLHKLGRTASALFASQDSLSTGSDHEDAKTIPFKYFAEYIVSDTMRQKLGPDCEEVAQTLKEVLLSGDANRLVAELTSVRVDDLAAPRPHLDWDAFFEPIVGLVILLNGVVIGIETDVSWDDWIGWVWIEAGFTLFFLLEITTRLKFFGPRQYFLGPEKAWAMLDVLIVVLGLLDFAMHMVDNGTSIGKLKIIRTCRVLRITRLFGIFRLSFLHELNIMVKGLLAGMRTLAWAIVLLFFTIYIIAILATHTLGHDPENETIATEELFTSVPRSMFTCFRCFVGDCTTAEGYSVVKLMSDAQGYPFALCYLFSFIIVTLGLFNLIMALYVEITLDAAKRTEEHDKKRQQRESLRIARTTKKLLKKFCVAQLLADPRKAQQMEVSRILKDSDEMDLDSDLSVSKELFLLIVQDQEVQGLMNELDIPPDRANLFEVLDADGTGDLHVTELVHGLLKVRGEARKSDVVASLLAVRAVQEMLRLLEKKVLYNQRKVMDHMGIKRKTKETSIWDLKVRRYSRGSYNSSTSTSPNFVQEVG